MDVSDSNLSQSNINIDGFDESKSMVVDNVKCSTANKTEARHQLPFLEQNKKKTYIEHNVLNPS
jgi:hypothetical protein